MLNCLQRLIILLFVGLQSLAGAQEKEISFAISPQVTLRAVYVPSSQQKEGRVKKVVLFLPGRASFYEKNTDFIQILAGYSASLSQDNLAAHQNIFRPEGLDVWTLDYRAHGKSSGRLPGDAYQRCHIKTFDDYLKDTERFISQHIIPHYGNQKIEFIVIGSSLGSHLALRLTQRNPQMFDKAILLAPMITFKTNPFPKSLARGISALVTNLGFGQAYAFGYKDWRFEDQRFDRFKSHHNRREFDETNLFLKENPDLITSGPTFSWVHAAFQSVDESLKKENIARIKASVSFILADEDHLVDNTAVTHLTKQLGKSKVVTIPGSRHNLLKETDPYRLPLLKEIYQEVTRKVI
jgi:lysophospholipase